jgi:hypothetical protein
MSTTTTTKELVKIHSSELPNGLVGLLIDLAYDACAGEYQRGLVVGERLWSGADLRGKAAEYGARYRDSRNSTIDRVNKAWAIVGWTLSTRIYGRYGRRVAVATAPTGAEYLW